MNKKDLIGQHVMIYQGAEKEGEAVIKRVEIEPSVVEILDGGEKVYTAYCKVKFPKDPETYMRWINTSNLMTAGLSEGQS